jgi:hypothetical protein
VRLVDASRPLEQARVEVEDIARVGLASGWALQQQRYLAIGPRVLGEVVVDDEYVAAALHEVLGHGRAGVGGEVLERRRLRGGGVHDDRVFHRAVLVERGDRLCDLRVLLPDLHEDADHVAAALVDDRVEREGALARGAVTDDQLPLTAPERHHRVDRLHARLERLVDVHAGDDVGGDALHRVRLRRRDRAALVERVTEGVHDAADQRLADRHGGDRAGGLDLVALLHPLIVAEHDRADGLLLEVEGEPADRQAGRVGHVELDQLRRLALPEAVDPRDAVTGLDHRAYAGLRYARVEVLDLLFEDRGDLFGSYGHRSLPLGRYRCPAVSFVRDRPPSSGRPVPARRAGCAAACVSNRRPCCRRSE